MPIVIPVPSPPSGPQYSGTTFLSLRNALALRLNDANKVFHTDDELKLHVQDAIRFWNCLTGDQKVKYALTVIPNVVWYDLNVINGSPRQATLTSQDIFLRLTYSLLEPPSNQAAVTTSQFSQNDLVQSVQRKRDEFLFKTGCTSTVEPLAVNAGVSTIVLPQSVIQVRNQAYWLPTIGTGSPVFKSDEAAASYFGQSSAYSPGPPVGFSAGMEPPLTLELTPAPDVDGTLECLTIESGASLSPSPGIVIPFPQDFIPGLTWGALADLLSMGLEKQDLQRAAYARQRFDEYVALMESFPFVFSSRVNGVPLTVDAVETLNFFSPNWRTVSANPSNVGLSGRNLVCYPTSQTQQIVLLMCANATVPTLDGDFVQLGDEILDTVLDEAQANAMQKCGGLEAQQAGELHGNIVKLAAQRNAKVRAMACFRDILYGRTMRENAITPMEVAAE